MFLCCHLTTTGHSTNGFVTSANATGSIWGEADTRTDGVNCLPGSMYFHGIGLSLKDCKECVFDRCCQFPIGRSSQHDILKQDDSVWSMSTVI